MLNLFSFTVFCSGVLIFESLLTRIYPLVVGPPRLYSILIFITLVLFFSLSTYIFLRFSKEKKYFPQQSKQSTHSKGLFIPILLVQLLIISLFVITSIQLLVYGSYHTILISLIVYLSSIAGLGYLIFISYQFIRWFTLNKKYVLVMYGIGFSLLAITIANSLLYLTFEISIYDPVLRLRNIHSQLMDDPSPTSQMVMIGNLYNYVSASSFVLIWIPTVYLLRTYYSKFSKIKYGIIVTIPILFYLFPLIVDQLDLFGNLRLEYGNTFDFYYTIFFSPYKQVGGLLFGLVFWLTSTRIKRENLQVLLQNASIGVILIFGTTVLYGLDAIIAPPFGIITISFVGMASYLLSTGIFYTASYIARDSVTRVTLHKIMRDQIDLLNNASLAERQKLLNKNVKDALFKVKDFEVPVSQYQEEEKELSKMVEEVLDEVNASRRDKKSSNVGGR